MDIAAHWVTTRHILDVAKQWCSKQLANSILLILSYYIQDCMYLVYFNAPVIWTYPTPIPSWAWWGTGTKILSKVPAHWYSALQTTNPNPNTIQSGSVLSCFLPLLGSHLATSGSSSGKYHFFLFLMRESYPSKWYNFIVWAARHLKESREELRLASSLWGKLSQTIVCNYHVMLENAFPKLYI